MAKILFLSKGEDSPSTRYRALQFFPLLQKEGFEARHIKVAGGVTAYLRALVLARRADVVVVLRKTFPEPYASLLRAFSRRLVFDFDDSIFCNSDGSFSETRMRRFVNTASRCDHLFAGNAFLAQQAGKLNPRVSIVPTCIDVSRYAPNHPKPEGTFDVVWIGSGSTRKYLEEALPALRLASLQIPNLRLKIVADFDLPDAGIRTLPTAWSAQGESAALGAAHIGIAPMSDDDWSRGKCALKVLQYMAAGLPVVSSMAGANAEVIVDGVSGYLTSDTQSMAARIVELAADSGLRERMGQEGRRRVVDEYSLVPVFARIQAVLRSLI